MTSSCRVFIATSLDGYIARDDGGIDWLSVVDHLIPPGEDMGYAAFMSNVDALVMGRGTFETAMGFGSWPYGATPVIVLSRQLGALPDNAPSTVRLHHGPPPALVAELAAQGLNRLYIDGGLTVQAFLADQLIDELTITTIPMLLGSGKPLFGALPADVRLQHVSTRAFEFGLVQTTWRVQR